MIVVSLSPLSFLLPFRSPKLINPLGLDL
jgi:hypothetical protein